MSVSMPSFLTCLMVAQVEGTRHYPFGRGLESEDDKGFERASLVQLPISLLTNTANDEGVPLCLERPEDAKQELSAFQILADTVSEKLLKYQYGHRDDDGIGLVSFGASEESFDVSTVTMLMSSDGTFTVRLFSETGAIQKQISPARLRSLDPKTGEEIPDSPFLREAKESESSQSDPVVTVHKTKGKQSPSLIPTKVERKGRYGFSVEFSDRAVIIYSMASIAKAAGGTIRT
jgi:hypothetical protein